MEAISQLTSNIELLNSHIDHIRTDIRLLTNEYNKFKYKHDVSNSNIINKISKLLITLNFIMECYLSSNQEEINPLVVSEPNKKLKSNL